MGYFTLMLLFFVVHYVDQMSFSSASDVLSIRDRFKYFFRTCPAQSAMSQPRIRLMKEYGWKRVAVIIESNEYFASVSIIYLIL